MKIKVNELENQILQALNKSGYSNDHATMIKDIVMFGEISGKKSHGLVRLFTGELNLLGNRGVGEIEIQSMTNKSAKIISHKHPGVLVGHIALNTALDIAKREQIAIVTSKGTQSTSGSLSYYLEKIAKEGYIGIVMSKSSPFVAPFNSSEPLQGTNPIGYAFPTNGTPLVFDMATSAITFGEIISASTTGDLLREGVAQDKNGNPTTNPNEALEGSVFPFDNSYKGSGLGMIVEILAGVLAGSSFIDLHEEDDWGNMFMVISPELFMPLESFKSRMDEYLNRMLNAKTKDGKKLRLPGMHTLSTRDENLQDNEIEIEDEIYNEFIKYL